MYAEHVPLMKAHGQTPSGFADIVTFAIVTQNQHFYRVKPILERMRSHGLEFCSMLTRRQKASIAHVQTEAADVLPLPPCTREALRCLVELPSIGIVKAAFVLQLLGYPIGCLDVHNMRIAGLARHVFDHIPTKAEGLSQKFRTYMDTCTALGGAEFLWDRWCHVVALKYPKWFPSANHVSAYHVDCIGRGSEHAGDF